MKEVTRLLSAIEQGDPHAGAQLLPLVYDELRRLAAQKLVGEKSGQTLQATALVHEIRALSYSVKPLWILMLRRFGFWRRIEFASRSGSERDAYRTSHARARVYPFVEKFCEKTVWPSS
jgi:hypothetical protein